MLRRSTAAEETSMNTVRIAAVTASLVVACSPAVAAVPSAAMNKTITISFTAGGTAKDPDGRTHPFSTSVTRTVYVSSAGRLFMRHTATANTKGHESRGGDFDPSDTRAGKGSFSFQGDRLVGVIPYAGGARQITATFDGSFSSCTASVIEGNAGSGSFMRKGPDGVVREISNATTSGVSCSIQSGNAFAQ
jgi:hypothetical protein